MPDEKNASAGGSENIFGEMDVQFGDISEAQEAIHATNWWKVGSSFATLISGLSVAAFAVFGADAYVKSAPTDSFIFSALPAGLFTKGGLVCGLLNANADAAYGAAEEPCVPLEALSSDVAAKTTKLQGDLRDVLPSYLEKKLVSNVLQSSLARYVLARGPESRIPYVKVLDDVAEQVARTKTELVKLAKHPSEVKVECGSVGFVGKSVSFSCAVDADGVLETDPRVTARVGVLTLMKNIQSIDKVRIKTYPKNLSSGGGPTHSSSSVQFDLEYLLDVNQL